MRLQNQIALVTGASSGIGVGVAKALAANGATVVINYRSHADEAAAVLADITAAGGQAIVYQADVSDETQVEKMFADLIAQFGTLHILVNNAGIQQDAAFVDMTLAQWNQVLAVNLTSQFLCSRAAVREFLRRGPQPAISRATGKIICMSSVHEEIPWGGHVNYATSKGGIKLFMESLAQELAPQKIRVVNIGPGAIQTPINRSAWATPEALAALLKLIPYNRIGQPEDIGNLAAWLASDEADYITGTTIFADGGMTLYPGFATGG